MRAIIILKAAKNNEKEETEKHQRGERRGKREIEMERGEREREEIERVCMNESFRTYSENALGVLRLASNKAQSSSLIDFSSKERGNVRGREGRE